MKETARRGRLRILQAGFNSQADFAMHLGIRESRLSRVLHGRQELKPSEREQWARVLNCKPDELFE